jgi:hypothetical protein
MRCTDVRTSKHKHIFIHLLTDEDSGLLLCYAMSGHVMSCLTVNITDVSEEHAASSFRVQQSLNQSLFADFIKHSKG